MFPLNAGRIPTIIFRLKVDAEGVIVPGTEYLVRDELALFAQAEWSWVDIHRAYHFADMTLAERHVEELKAEGVSHVHWMPYGEDLRAARDEYGRRHRSRSSDEVYAETARRLGERD